MNIHPVELFRRSGVGVGKRSEFVHRCLAFWEVCFRGECLCVEIIVVEWDVDMNRKVSLQVETSTGSS